MSKPPTQARLPLLIAVGLLGLAILVLIGHATHFDFINDDAFISFRYADNLARHGELTYNLGERVEGYTNFLWTLILSAVIFVGGDPVPWSKGLGVALSVGTLAVLWAFSRWWASTLEESVRASRHPAWASLAPILLALSPAFAAWSEGGLETALFTFLVTAGVLGAVREEVTRARVPLSAFVLALAAMTRPEGVLVFGLVGLAVGTHALITARTRETLVRHALWGAAFALVYGPYWLWRWSYYGFLFPNTYYAKGEGALWGPGLDYVGSFISDTHIWLLLPLLFVRWRGAHHEGLMLSVIGAVVLPYLAYVARVGGDFMALHRFLVPLLPLLLWVMQESVASLWARVEPDRLGVASRLRAAMVGVALLALLGWTNFSQTERALEVGSDRGVDSIGWLKQFVVQTTAIGKHLAATRPATTTLATTAAGTIPYYSKMRTLDLLCLNDAVTAHTVQAHGGRPGHAKSAPEPYVLRWRPDILLWHPRLSKTVPRPHGGERRYWSDRGYEFGYAKVAGLQPPYWSYFEVKKTASP